MIKIKTSQKYLDQQHNDIIEHNIKNTANVISHLSAIAYHEIFFH
jgi:hypothetical protein